MADLALVELRHEIEPLRERAVGLGLARHDAGLGLDADREDHPVGDDARLRREGAGRPAPRATGSARPARPGRAGSSGTSWPHCCAPRSSSERSLRSLLDRLPICSLTVLSSSGFTSCDDVELDAGELHAAVGERDLAGEIGLDPPVRQQRRPRRHRDVAADVGALVEHAGGELLHLAAELVAEEPADRAGEIAALVGDLAGDAERAVERGRDVQRRSTRRRPRAARARWSSRCRPCRAVRSADCRSCRSGRAARWPPARRGWRASRPRPAR